MVLSLYSNFVEEADLRRPTIIQKPFSRREPRAADTETMVLES